MKKKCQFWLCHLLPMLLIWCECSAARDAPVRQPDKAPYRLGADGMAMYLGEFAFAPFPAGWELLSHGEGNEPVIVFYRKDPGSALSRTIITYNEEPYGYSRQLEERSREFLERFLWDAVMEKQVLARKKTQALGREGLDLVVEARDGIARKKVRSEIVFAKRGERVVAFYAVQWRQLDEHYDLSAFEVFSRFVGSFRTLKKSFYENL